MNEKILELLIPEPAFKACWQGAVALYASFIRTTSEKLRERLPSTVGNMTAAIKSTGDNRIRIDGQVKTHEGDKEYSVEMVWLPSSQTYRGTVTVSDVPPEAESKSVTDFIEALDAIVDDDEIIFEGQVFNAFEGLDEESPDLAQAYPAIFRLFERLPAEGFGNPGSLVHLMEQRGGFEDLLLMSVKRCPSIPAIIMINRLLNRAGLANDKCRWMKELESVAESKKAIPEVRDLARELLEFQSSRDTEQGRGQNGGSPCA